jgi:hypothetical protein
MEELEEANDSQLYSILHELSKTAMFRNFMGLEPASLRRSKGGSVADDEQLLMEEEDEQRLYRGQRFKEDDEPLCSVEGGDPRSLC